MSEESKEQIKDNLWKAFEAKEFEGRLLFPGKLTRRKANGKFEHIDVLLRVPREPELRKARIEARRLAIDSGLDIDRDKDLVDDLEIICILVYAIRNNKPPSGPNSVGHEQWAINANDLEENYDRQSIISLWNQLEEITRSLTPSEEKISEDQFILILSAMAKERSIHPLAVYGPDVQSIFILTMVDRLVNYMESK